MVAHGVDGYVNPSATPFFEFHGKRDARLCVPEPISQSLSKGALVENTRVPMLVNWNLKRKRSLPILGMKARSVVFANISCGMSHVNAIVGVVAVSLAALFGAMYILLRSKSRGNILHWRLVVEVSMQGRT